ncbi:MAG: type III pantothenate kinase [SAR202 cluster bacterium]|nr:type III pantothenate kinase [SAR202 cluster bacterium]
MLLAIDIGNTNVTLGVFDGEALKATWRVATEPGRMPDEYGLFLRQLLPLKGVDPGNVTAVSMCSVVPPLTQTFVDLCKTYFSATPLVVGAGVKTGVRVLYDNPRDVGSDRIADAAAAVHFYGKPAIIVDFGTATVFDAVTKDGEYLGGAIAPGMQVAAEALYHRTSQLRRVELVRPPAAIGRSTVHSMQSGLVLGYADMVTGMVARFKKELGDGCKVIATGGLAELIAKEARVFDAVDVNLTLTGLRIIYEMNTGQ